MELKIPAANCGESHDLTEQICFKSPADSVQTRKGGNDMKKLIIGILFIMLTTGVVFAGGDQNQGTTGSGTTSTGTGSQGTASQPRTGR